MYAFATMVLQNEVSWQTEKEPVYVVLFLYAE
jgi:hypothetical protein